jgi:hypothetical protein
LSEAIFDFEAELERLDRQETELDEAAGNVRNFSTSNSLSDPAVIKNHCFEDLVGELGAKVIAMTSESVSSAAASCFAQQQPLDEPDEKDPKPPLVENTAADWKTKLVFILLLICLAVAATIAGFYGPQVPIVMPDGNYSTTTHYVYSQNGTEAETAIQTVMQPLISSQLVVFAWICCGVAAVIIYLPGLIGNFLALFTKKPAAPLPPKEQLAKYLTDKLQILMDRYVADFCIQAWQPATKENSVDFEIEETEAWVYSMREQSMLTFPKFCIGIVNEVLAISKQYAKQQRLIIYQHLDNVGKLPGTSTASTPVGA